MEEHLTSDLVPSEPDPTRTIKDVLIITGTVFGAAVFLLVVILSAIGSMGLALYLSAIAAGLITTFLTIALAMKLLTVHVRALAWHGLWFLLSVPFMLWLMAEGNGIPTAIGIILGLIAGLMTARRKNHLCFEIVSLNATKTYSDANGKIHQAALLQIREKPIAGLVVRGTVIVFFAIAMLAWGSLFNAFEWLHYYMICWAVLAGFVATYTLVTMLEVAWLEHSFRIHVFLEQLPRGRIREAFVGNTVGQRRGTVLTLLGHFEGLWKYLRNLYSVSVRP